MKRSLLFLMAITLFFSCTACGAAPVGSSAQSEPSLPWDIPWDTPAEEAILLAEERSGIQFTPSFNKEQELYGYYGYPEQELKLFGFPVVRVGFTPSAKTGQFYSYYISFISYKDDSLDAYFQLTCDMLTHLIATKGLPDESSYMLADLSKASKDKSIRFDFPIKNGKLNTDEIRAVLEHGDLILLAVYPNCLFLSRTDRGRTLYPIITITAYSPTTNHTVLSPGESLGSYTEYLKSLEP